MFRSFMLVGVAPLALNYLASPTIYSRSLWFLSAYPVAGYGGVFAGGFAQQHAQDAHPLLGDRCLNSPGFQGGHLVQVGTYSEVLLLVYWPR